MYHDKPIIGVAGGIGSGKTHLARALGDLGASVITSDRLVRTAYTHPAVKRAVMDLLGEEVFTPAGDVDMKAVGGRVFRDMGLRQKLEAILHPVVNEARLMRMQAAAEDPDVTGYVWDSPLLFETELSRLCDVVWFVDAPEADRERRTRERGWPEGERQRREAAQWPVERKRAESDATVVNSDERPATAEALAAMLEDLAPAVACCGGRPAGGGCCGGTPTACGCASTAT